MNVQVISKIATNAQQDSAEMNKAQVVTQLVVEPDQDATVVL
jgi:hypothetical protein